jgi:UDP-3-O-[3-hydroxymyristoyl] glucosamine N-acyltransferase
MLGWKIAARIPVLQLYAAPALAAKQRGMYTPGELIRLANKSGFQVVNPFNTYISRGVRIFPGTVIHPNVTIEKPAGEGMILIGENNQLFSGLTIRVNINGTIQIGHDNEIGDQGGLIATYLNPEKDGSVTIGDSIRLTRSFEILGGTTIGRGAQVLGAAIIKESTLEGGLSYKLPRTNSILKPSGVVVKDRSRVHNSTLKAGSIVHQDVTLENSIVETNVEVHRFNVVSGKTISEDLESPK